MTSTPLNPKQTLNNFFITDGVLAFHDETTPLGCFSDGYIQAELTNSNFGAPTSNLTIVTSTEGGAVRLITPVVPINQAALINYIKTHNLSPNAEPSLQQIQLESHYFLQFSANANSETYQLPFENSKLELTHQESTQVVSAVQGSKALCSFITQTRFTVNCAVKAKLNADWISLLSLAIENKKTDKEALVVLINQQIAAGCIQIEKSYVNTPSKATEEKVKDSLVDTAAMLAANSLENISNIHQLPDKVHYDVCYNQSIPQTYQWHNEQDLADTLSRIPFGNIVSHSPTPLPSPGRKPHPPKQHTQCDVSLGFKANDYQILSIELAWADQTCQMEWPNFPLVTLEAEGKPEHLEITVTYTDYCRFVHTFLWQPKLVLTPENIGFCCVRFDAQSISNAFEKITGNARYLANNQAKEQQFQFNFSHSNWDSTWQIRTLTQGLDGRIEYQWTGEKKSLFHKNYDSGKHQSTTEYIELQYH